MITMQSKEKSQEVNEKSGGVTLLRILPFVVSIALFGAAPIMANFNVQIVQSNGLLEILYPFEQYSYLLYATGFALLMFTILFNLAISKHSSRISIVSSSLLASGVTVTLFFALTFFVLLRDYAGRCITPCEPFVEQYFVLSFGMFSAIILGLCLTGIGMWKSLSPFQN
jgi:hypothetical protein